VLQVALAALNFRGAQKTESSTEGQGKA